MFPSRVMAQAQSCIAVTLRIARQNSPYQLVEWHQLKQQLVDMRELAEYDEQIRDVERVRIRFNTEKILCTVDVVSISTSVHDAFIAAIVAAVNRLLWFCSFSLVWVGIHDRYWEWIYRY